MRSITLLSLFSFLYCYYCIFFTFQTSLASTKCLEDQQSLLLQFKNNLTFHPEYSTKLILWNKSTACCNWSGVTCDNEGHVIGLDLSGEHIHGGLNNSSSLFSLQYLQKLNLGDNYFNSSIPSAFNKLMKLTHLNLSDNDFLGKIPIEISQLTRLVTLDLSFSITSPLNLEKLMQNLTSIRQLYLDGITPWGHEWSNALLPLRDLQELSMYNCSLSGHIDSSLSKLENLSVIILGDNNFSSPMPQTFAKFKNLSTLNLKNCGLTGTFPQKIFQIRTLSFIDLSDNPNLHVFFPDYSLSESLHSIRVSNTSFSGALPNSMSNLTQLTSLYLEYNNLNGVIPSYLFTLPSLKEIWLRSNQFSKFDEFINVSSSVLEHLDLSRNNLSGPFPTSIFQLSALSSLSLSTNKLNGSLQLYELFKLRNLTDLDLSYNNLSINGNDANVDQVAFPNIKRLFLASCKIQTFPRFFMNRSTLISLDLSDNNIQGVVPNWIWKLQSLQWLNISHNFLTKLEGSLQNLTSIWVVDLHNNQLQGSIPVFPESIGFLDYSTNNFSVIPHDIGNYLSSSFSISLSNNNLQGSIPHSLCKASNLRWLDISFNNISETIPPCLMTMTSTLEALNLRNNNLNSFIPDMFPTSCVASSLNFHGNLLHGPIPKSLSHCSSLKVLDIGSNQIVDRFPCFLTKIPTLSVLVLRNNKFYGSIECSHLIENKPWKTIQIVDIAFNNFLGKLPEKFFTTWERMKHDEDVVSGNKYIPQLYNSYYHDSVTITCKGHQMELVKILTNFVAIDFSSNCFEGPIPEVLMNFKALYVLNFSNNDLSGEIPSTIGNLKQLESLDLSYNSLVGTIPMQLAGLSFLSYLNLSFNHLVGKIPTGTQRQSFEASSFEGNDGLYGPPLPEKPNGKRQDLHPKPACGRLACSVNWKFLSVELGFIFGLGIIMVPVMFWKRWRVRYWKLVDKTLCWIFSRMYLEYKTDRGQTYVVLRW